MEGPARAGRCLAPGSNSAAGGGGQPTSTPASPRPVNGTSRPDTRSSPRPAARSPMQKAMTCNSGVAAKALSCRNSSPGAILTRRDDSLFVKAGLVPAIQVLVAPRKQDVDARDNPPRDEFFPTSPGPAPKPASAASPAA